MLYFAALELVDRGFSEAELLKELGFGVGVGTVGEGVIGAFDRVRVGGLVLNPTTGPRSPLGLDGQLPHSRPTASIGNMTHDSLHCWFR